MTARLYQSREVAEIFGIPRWKLNYLIRRKVIPGATYQMFGRRLFTAANVTKIRKALAKRARSLTGRAGNAR